ncbi:hypothetical protein D9611_011300 [Ephemerocybe angulata]|uniref:NAD-dependent epimerase/dehydratase domain-containing protein n=1 Tax=Ephemerocybe angulata TaxID=980116 RepID=A0A8H5F1P9_9AGAR|nr:hypothetical protein D9611_011300 [Tulosesus angulatus]
MPILSSPSTVLVTGGTGYIGAWVIAVLLERGHTVKAVVRSGDKGEVLRNDLLRHTSKSEIALEAVVIEDLLKEGAFDDVVVGVDAVVHLASPVVLDGSGDPENIIKPAVGGVLGVLKSALRASQADGNASLKRIVITSSVAAVYIPEPEKARVFTEADWNEVSLVEVKELGAKASGMAKYRASKVYSERAVWEFYDAHKAEIKWDITTLNPPWVFGPPIQDPATLLDMPMTLKLWYGTVVASEPPKTREAMQSNQGWIDVRDLAEAHVRALEKEKAGGERILVVESTYIFQEWLDIANKVGSEVYKKPLPKGFPDLTEGVLSYKVNYNTEKEKRILGVTYRSKEETARDILQWAATKGW